MFSHVNIYLPWARNMDVKECQKVRYQKSKEPKESQVPEVIGVPEMVPLFHHAGWILYHLHLPF